MPSVQRPPQECPELLIIAPAPLYFAPVKRYLKFAVPIGFSTGLDIMLSNLSFLYVTVRSAAASKLLAFCCQLWYPDVFFYVKSSFSQQLCHCRAPVSKRMFPRRRRLESIVEWPTNARTLYHCPLQLLHNRESKRCNLVNWCELCETRKCRGIEYQEA